MTPPPTDPTTPAISEDELAEHLRRRGSGTPPPGLAAAIAERVAVERAEPRWRRAIAWKSAVAVAAAVVIVVGAAFVARPTPPGGSASPSGPTGSGSVAVTSPSIGPTASSEPSVGASPSASGVAVSSGTIVWGVDDLVARLAAGSLRTGDVVVTDLVDGDLSPFWPVGVAHSCPQLCPMWKLGSGEAAITIYQSMLEPAPTTTTGRLGFLVDDRSLRLLGPVTTSSDGGAVALTPAAVPPGRPGTFTAVHGWLRDGPLVPCPAPIGPQASGLPVGLDQQRIGFRCPWTWIQPTAAFPGVTNADGSGSIGLPAGGLFVQNGADGSSQTAREGDFLVRPVLACPPGVYCAFVPVEGRHWDLIGDAVGP
jgi:hypothetical protein